MLDYFAPLFEFTTEKSRGTVPHVGLRPRFILLFLLLIDCWLILCQLVELLASFQVSQTDVQKLILKFQGSKAHMVQIQPVYIVCVCGVFMYVTSLSILGTACTIAVQDFHSGTKAAISIC